MKYLLEADLNHGINGNVKWYRGFMERYRKEGFGWPKWDDNIVGLVPEIDGFESSVRSKFQVSFLAFDWRSAPLLDCARTSLIQQIGENVVRDTFHLIPMRFAGGEAVDDWFALFPRKEAIVDSLDVLNEPKYAERALATSRDYLLIMSEDCFQRIKGIRFPECKIRVCDDHGKAISLKSVSRGAETGSKFDVNKVLELIRVSGTSPKRVTEKSFVDFEELVGDPLPSEFAQFLRHCSGVKTVPLEFVTEGSSTILINEFYWVGCMSANKGSIQSYLSFWRNLGEGEGLLPFAGDGYGDLLLIRTRGRGRGGVNHWNHEGEEIARVSRSFEKFVSALERA